MTDQEARDLHDQVLTLVTALVGNGLVEGAIPRIERALERAQRSCDEHDAVTLLLDRKLHEHLTRHDERGRLWKAATATGVLTSIPALFTAIFK
jgi:hypothetical protein